MLEISVRENEAAGQEIQDPVRYEHAGESRQYTGKRDQGIHAAGKEEMGLPGMRWCDLRAQVEMLDVRY